MLFKQTLAALSLFATVLAQNVPHHGNNGNGFWKDPSCDHHGHSSSEGEDCWTTLSHIPDSYCCTDKPPCCTTYTTRWQDRDCCIKVDPCSTNTSCYVTQVSYVTVSPTSTAAPTVAPTSEKAVCTPCTSYVTETTQQAVICTTMVFCDVADQSGNCLAQDMQVMNDIVKEAMRDGAKVYVNGELVADDALKGYNANAAGSIGMEYVLAAAAGLLGIVNLL